MSLLDGVAERLEQARGGVGGDDAFRIDGNVADRTPEHTDPQPAGALRTSSAYGRAGGTAKYGSPRPGPFITSSNAAESRTVRVTANSTEKPPQRSPRPGPKEQRPRVVLRPTRPHIAAGPRIEPPPSLACAAGTMPAATAAAEPPLEPPAVWVRFHGLRVGPKARGSDDGRSPSSGVLVRPSEIKPAALILRVRKLSSRSRHPAALRNAMPAQ